MTRDRKSHGQSWIQPKRMRTLVSLKRSERIGEPEIWGHVVGLGREVSELVQFQMMSSSREGPRGRRRKKVKIEFQELRNFRGWSVGWFIQLMWKSSQIMSTLKVEKQQWVRCPSPWWMRCVARGQRGEESGVGWWLWTSKGAGFCWDAWDKEQPLLEECKDTESRHLNY